MTHHEANHALVGPAAEANLFAVLAHQARRHTSGKLAATAFGGIMNAAFIAQRTNLWWLASAYVAVSSYGAWGVFDALHRTLDRDARGAPAKTLALNIGRTVAASAGIIAVLAAVGGFMGAALGGWIL